MELTIKANAFQEMSLGEMQAVDGGDWGAAASVLGGTLMIAAGTLIVVAGAATLNPFAAGGGLGAITSGVSLINYGYNR